MSVNEVSLSDSLKRRVLRNDLWQIPEGKTRKAVRKTVRKGEPSKNACSKSQIKAL